MKKHVLFAMLWLLFTLVSLNQLQAQDVQEPAKVKVKKSVEIPRLAKFVTFELTDLGFASGGEYRLGGTLGYEQFLSERLSVIGGINYEHWGGPDFFPSSRKSTFREIELRAGLRYRILTGRRLSLFASAQAGVGFGKQFLEGAGSISDQTYTDTRPFLNLSLGVEYRFSDRVKATAELMTETDKYDTFYLPQLRLGAQIRLGK